MFYRTLGVGLTRAPERRTLDRTCPPNDLGVPSDPRPRHRLAARGGGPEGGDHSMTRFATTRFAITLLLLVGLTLSGTACARSRRTATTTSAPADRTPATQRVGCDALEAPVRKPAAATERVALFDGSDLSHWTQRDGSPAKWKITDDGAMEVAGGAGDIVSKEVFDDCQIHVEFMPPVLPPEVKGQDRGNSGVYVQGRYEVQVLDSWGVQPDKGDCGAIYDIKKPDNNACRPPGQWQTYDITFRAARFDASGKKTRNARIN